MLPVPRNVAGGSIIEHLVVPRLPIRILPSPVRLGQRVDPAQGAVGGQ